MSPTLEPEAQLDLLLRDTAAVVPVEDLRSKLRRSVEEGKPLRVKLGIDPSRPDLHLGHAVVLRKLRQFQELGHVAVLIIGDFTGRVGDPSGQSETRPLLSEGEIEANALTYFEQAGRVVDMERAEVHRNSEWLAGMSMADVLSLTASATVARMLERNDFRARYEEGKPISVVEFLYPLMQAMDSVRTEADVEMGGTDQTFNLLMGRDVQARYGQEPQVVFTMPLLEGLDGERKMSKSFGNYVGLEDPPEEMFGKLMSVPDALIDRYLSLCTDLRSDPKLTPEERGLLDGGHPHDRKRLMASGVVAAYHGWEEARRQEARFDAVHRDREIPDDVPEMNLPPDLASEVTVWVPRLVVALGLAGSNGEARRLIEQGGVRIGGRRVSDPAGDVAVADLSGAVIQVGRRKFVRVRAAGSG